MSSVVLAMSTAQTVGVTIGVAIFGMLVVAGWYRAEALRDQAERERRAQQGAEDGVG